MKKICPRLITGVALLISVTSCMAVSKTFFMPRSLIGNSVFELAQSNYDIYHNSLRDTDRPVVNLYGSAIFQQSRHSSDLASYFFPGNQESISFTEDGSGDVDSLWFNLISEAGTYYESVLTMSPKRRMYAGYITTHVDLCRIMNGLWFSFDIVPMHVEHKLNLDEVPSDHPGIIAGFTTTEEALNNSSWWQYGRFSNGKVSKTRIDDIQVKLGHDHFFCDNKYRVGGYLVTTIPTGNRPESVYVFEPIVGSKHWSLGLGLTGDWMIFKNDKHSLNFMVDGKYRYVFKGTERRSFDLTNGEWSRYLQVALQTEPWNSTPAINLLTHSVKVHPRSVVDVWSALHYTWCNWNLEVGYDFWWRQKEEIHGNFDYITTSSEAIFDIGGVCTNPISCSSATIAEALVGEHVVVSDVDFTPLTAADVNVSSAEHPRALSNTIFANISRNGTLRCHPTTIGIGGLYEFAHDRNALEQFAVWLKMGIDF